MGVVATNITEANVDERLDSPGRRGGVRAVVTSDVCVGCGACGSLDDGRLPIEWTGDRYVSGADRVEATPDWADRVCPFSDHALDEDALGAALFPEARPHPEIGRHLKTSVGWSNDPTDRLEGSSGGLATWLLRRLLEDGVVDAVAHVKPQRPGENGGRLFAYGLSGSVEELRAGSKSHYYPVEISGVVDAIRARPGRYAIVAVPCVAKALRLLMQEDAVLAERLAFVVGITCGHMKSAAFAQALAWQVGIDPDAIESVDFRHKLPDRPANAYGARIVGRTPDGGQADVVLPMPEAFVRDWGVGWFRLNACEFCDDVLAEVADVSFGDAWLPEYVRDWKGANIVVPREPRTLAILEAAKARGEIVLDPTSADRVAESQRAGLRHRREGLAYRLQLRRDAGVWAPRKRVAPRADHIGPEQQRIYRLRGELAEASHRSFAEARVAGRFDVFTQAMTPLVDAYQQVRRRTQPKKALTARAKNAVRRVETRLRQIIRDAKAGWRRA